MAVKQKILIVDDDNNIAELISLYLTKECYDTKIVNDGEQALIAFEHYKPNMLLLDLMLPGIDGYQVCREIRKDSNVPIIMLSAKGERSFIQLADGDNGEYVQEAICPIISEGDVIGAVILLNADTKTKMGEVEQKLIQSAAGFLGRQMEQ